MPSTPKYGPNDIVYLRESAALGFLEAVRISTATLARDGWVYVIQIGVSQPTPGFYYGNKFSLVNAETVYYPESDFCDKCEALILAEANAKRAYDSLRGQRQALCPDVELTGSG